MKTTLLSLAVLSVAVADASTRPRPPFGPQGKTCSDRVAFYKTAEATYDCEDFYRRSDWFAYPADFAYKNSVTHYKCPKSGLHIIRSNGIPDHDVKVANPNKPCEHDYQFEFALKPSLVAEAEWREPGDRGVQAVAMNGVPIYGAQEAGSQNAVLGKGIQDAKYWYGHAAQNSDWHYHHPWVGSGPNTPNATQLLGYALDGFPIYGPVADPDKLLDSCNGRTVQDNGLGGTYQYHVRAIDTVDGDGDYCNGTSPAIRWNYVLGCFRGDMSKTVVSSSKTRGALPADCVAETPAAAAALRLRGAAAA